MHRKFYNSLERMSDGESVPLTSVIDRLSYSESGLVPVVTQDAASKDVLMLAWMNKEALQLTLSTGRVTYWSRSRQQLWIKGETSGHTQALVSMSFDCDGDAILCQVDQSGAACHTGRPDCFYLAVDKGRQQVLISGDAAP